MRGSTCASPRTRLLPEIIAFALPLGATAFSTLSWNRALPFGNSHQFTALSSTSRRQPLFCHAMAESARVQSTFISNFPASQVIVGPRSGLDRSLSLLEQQLSNLKLKQEFTHSTTNSSRALIHAVAMQLVHQDPSVNLTEVVESIDERVAIYLGEHGNMKSIPVPDSDIGREIFAITDLLQSSVRLLHVGVDGLTSTLCSPPAGPSDATLTIISVGPVIWSTAPVPENTGGAFGDLMRLEDAQLIREELSERLVRAKALSTAVSWMSTMRRRVAAPGTFAPGAPHLPMPDVGGPAASHLGHPTAFADRTEGPGAGAGGGGRGLPQTANMLDFFTAPGEVSSTQLEELSEDREAAEGWEEEGAASEVERSGPGGESGLEQSGTLPLVMGSIEALPVLPETERAGAVEVEVERQRGPAAAAKAAAVRGGEVGAGGEGDALGSGDDEGEGGVAGEHFVLIDVSGYIYRAYHKVPAMTNPQGQNINSVRSFCLNLMRLLFQTFPQANLVAVFDHPGGSFRKDIAATYKANRPPPPEDLIPQFGLVREAAAAFGVPQVEMAGFEADDVIASIAQRVAQAGGQVTLISSDKDLFQLLSSAVQMYSPLDKAYILPDKVLSKFGVGPDQVAQVQALAGDSSDNVPGVPGIGVKTAAKLINEFGTVEDLLASAPSIKQKRVRESLITHAEAARVSLELVTLRTDVPLPPLAELRRRTSSADSIQAFFDTHGISLPIPPMVHNAQGSAPAFPAPGAAQPAMPPGAGGAGVAAAKADRGGSAWVEGEYELVEDLAGVGRWAALASEKGMLALEVVATSGGGQEAEMTGLAVAVSEGEAAYIPLRHVAEGSEEGEVVEACLQVREVLEAMRGVLEDDGVLKVGHGLKLVVALVGRELEGVNVAPFDDVMLLSFVLDAGRGFDHSLPDLAEQYLGKGRPPLGEVEGKKKARGKQKPELLPPEAVREYAAGGADLVLRLHAVLKPRLVAAGLVKTYERIERPLLPVLARMEARGVAVDILRLRGLSEGYANQVAALEAKIFDIAGMEFSVASPKQLANVLFERMGLPAKKKGKKSEVWSTDADVLDELAKDGNEIAQHIIEWRSISKLKSTYADPLVKLVNPRTDRLHTSFMMAAAVTGRLSSVEPNLQNIPNMGVGKDIRKAFIADEGYKLLSADYSQIELRLLAHIADIQPLVHAFHNNIDIHKLTASQVFGIGVEEVTPEQRKSAKAINFGIIYGQSAFGLAKQLDISQKEAKAYIGAYFAQYPGIGDYMERAKDSAQRNGYVETLFGRRCHIPNMGSGGSSGAYAGRKAINAPIQGTAADVIKVAMVRMEEALECAGLKTRMLLQVHDELLFEVLEGEEEEATAVIKDVMEQACLPAHPLSVPLTVDVGIGDSWEDAH